MNDLAFERELRSALYELVPDAVPASLSDTVAALPQRRRPGLTDAVGALLRRGLNGRRIAAASMSVLAVAMVAVIGTVVVLGYGLLEAGSLGAGAARAYDWQTQVVNLEANSITIIAGGRKFHVPADAQVHSDPGDSTYRTLELDWSEQEIEQRLYIYFAADNANWWITEIRTYDGALAAEWLYYDVAQVETPRGQSYVGSLDLSGTGTGGSGELRIDDMRLTAFAPGTGVVFQPGCHPADPGATPGDQPAPQQMDPDLSRYGIQAGIAASDADSRLTAAGICHEFRYDYTASNYAQVWCVAPPGIVNSWAYGSSDQVIMFVEASPGETLPPSAPLLVGCGSSVP